MKCNVCIKAKKQNVLTEGTNNFRTTTLTRHAQSNDHQLSVIPKSADLIEVVSKAALSDNESAIIVAFHCVYWLASEDLPMHKYGSMINLLKILNCWYVDKLCHSQTATYNSETTANDMLESIATAIRKTIDSKLLRSPFISVFADESRHFCT